MNESDTSLSRQPDQSLVTLLHVTYALHALGLAIGAFGASTIVGSFVFGWPSIIAVIINPGRLSAPPSLPHPRLTTAAGARATA